MLKFWSAGDTGTKYLRVSRRFQNFGGFFVTARNNSRVLRNRENVKKLLLYFYDLLCSKKVFSLVF